MTVTTRSGMSAAKTSELLQSAKSGWWPAIVAIGLGLVAIFIAHDATVSEAVSIWNRSEPYKFAWAVLPTLAYLLWHNRRRLAPLVPTASPLGIVAAAACAVLWIVGDLLNIAEGRQFALVIAICAVILAAVGWSVFKVLLPFLSVLVFLVPTGGFLLEPLKHIAVAFVQGFAAVVGFPFRTEGFSMFVGTQRYVVIDYCAALPYVLIGLFLGLTLGLLIYRSWWKIAAMALLGGGLAIVANGLRIIGIITYDYMTGSELTVAQHAYFELPALALSNAVLFIVFSRLTSEPMPPAASRPPTPDAGAPLRCTVSVLLAVALISSAPFVWKEQLRVPVDRATQELLPLTVSGLSRKNIDADWQPRALSKTVSTSLATYGNQNRQISVFVAQATSRRDKVSGGAIDLVGDEMWMPALRRQLSACTGTQCHDVQYSKLLLRDSQHVRHVYTVYAIEGDTMVSPFELRLRRAWAKLNGAAAPARLIAIVTEDAGGLSTAEIAAFIQAVSSPRPLD